MRQVDKLAAIACHCTFFLFLNGGSMTTKPKPLPVDQQQHSEQSNTTITQHFDVAFYHDGCKAWASVWPFAQRKSFFPIKTANPLP